MRQCMDADNLHRRLKKIIGQVQAIDRMIDEDIRSGSDQRGQVRPSRVRQGGAGGTHPALRPGRHPTWGRGQDHRELHQGGGTVREYEIEMGSPLTGCVKRLARGLCFYDTTVSHSFFLFFSFSVTTRSYRHTDSTIPAASAVMVMLLQPSARKGRLEKWLNW